MMDDTQRTRGVRLHDSRTGGWTRDENGVPRGSRRDRKGRNLVEGWMLAAGAVVIVAGAFLAARSLSAAPAKTTVASASAVTVTGGGKQVEEAPASPEPTAAFAKIGDTDVPLHFPATAEEFVAVGFHQAWNAKATDMEPQLEVHPRDEYESTKKALKDDRSLKLFLMMSRGRGSSEYSAVDCAVKPDALLVAPVSGTVTLVKKYKLEGTIDDYHIEFKADGAEKLRVVMIHVKDVSVKEGDRVEGGVTPVATVRHLPIDSQVNRYLPVEADHTHIQINAEGYKLNEAS